MKKLFALVLVLFLMGSLAYAGQPKLKEAKIEPSVASTGDSVKITVEFTGKKKDIKSVTLLVREYPYEGPRIELQPDPESKKNVWVATGVVPWDAPAETFHLDISAIDKNGKEIVTKGFENITTGRTGTIIFKVKY